MPVITKPLTVHLVLQVRRQCWYLMNCDVEHGVHVGLTLPTVIKRKFYSQAAAVDYLTRFVRKGLGFHPHLASRTLEVVCTVTRNPLSAAPGCGEQARDRSQS
jgi:hypothetical protein